MTPPVILTGANVAEIALVAAAVAAISAAAGLLFARLLRTLARRWGVAVLDGSFWRSPVTVIVVLSGLYAYNVLLGRDWAALVAPVLGSALLVACGWLALVVTRTLERGALARFADGVADDRRSRHARTQIVLLQRVASSLIVVITLGLLLWRIPAVREIGAGVLASAGILSVIAGIAAQTTLGNVFAGLQIAFTDAIRVGDIVSVEGRWGTAAEITLTYVVLRLPDGTSVIMPSTYFTTTPFRNWTHAGSRMVAEVDLVVAWNVPVAAVRDELRQLVEATDGWDGELADVVVQESTTNGVLLRALISTRQGEDVDRLCQQVREGLVAYLRSQPASQPRTNHRIDHGGHDAPDPRHDAVSTRPGT
jgi:small-conductance mechanosensitive channel